MKSERTQLALTIAQLVRNATPVRPLASPSHRVARWAMVSTAFVVVSVLILGVRSDFSPQMANLWFLGRAIVTVVMAIAAASVAASMVVPGAEPSPRRRALPVALWVAWGAMLLGPIAVTGSPVDLLLRVQPHFSCVLRIAFIALAPGVVLVGCCSGALLCTRGGLADWRRWPAWPSATSERRWCAPTTRPRTIWSGTSCLSGSSHSGASRPAHHCSAGHVVDCFRSAVL